MTDKSYFYMLLLLFSQHATAADTEYHADLADGIYVVRVNGMAKKVESHR